MKDANMLNSTMKNIMADTENISSVDAVKIWTISRITSAKSTVKIFHITSWIKAQPSAENESWPDTMQTDLPQRLLEEEEKIVSTFDAIQELIELLGVDWETASQIYLFETEEGESDDQRTI